MAKKALMATVLSLVLAAPVAYAGSTACPLEPTPKGFELDAQGRAQVTDGRGQSVEVKLSADLDDGTVLIVTASMRDGQSVDLGAISMLLGAGEFTLDGTRDRYSKAFPTRDIVSIGVELRGTALLKGLCGAGVTERR